jgi:hypothetical protein
MSKEYYNKKGYINASLLKALSNSPKEALAILKGEESEKTPSLSFGSLVDCLLTTPERFQEDYIIYQGKVPTEKLLDFANKYLEIINLKAPDEVFSIDDVILSARVEVGYDARLLSTTVISRFKEECSGYCDFYTLNKDKIIVSQEDFNLAQKLNSSTRNSPYLQHIFNPEPNTIVLFQVPIFIVTNKGSFKVLLDVVVIDLLNKTVSPYDFKTYADDFVKNYFTYKYYYQESLYTTVLELLRLEDSIVSVEMPEELKVITSEFTIQQFKFIAIDKSLNRNIEIFESYKGLAEDVFFNGIIKKSNEFKIKSILYLLDEFNYRVEKENWIEDYEMITKGVKKLWL